MNRTFTERIHEYTERYAIRLGIRTLDFTAVWVLANFAGSYLTAWGEARGLGPLPSMPQHEFVAALTTTTALYESAVRQRFANLPTAFATGLLPRKQPIPEPQEPIDNLHWHALARPDVTLPWPEK